MSHYAGIGAEVRSQCDELRRDAFAAVGVGLATATLVALAVVLVVWLLVS